MLLLEYTKPEPQSELSPFPFWTLLSSPTHEFVPEIHVKRGKGRPKKNGLGAPPPGHTVHNMDDKDPLVKEVSRPMIKNAIVRRFKNLRDVERTLTSILTQISEEYGISYAETHSHLKGLI